jgi:hypothetical protein
MTIVANDDLASIGIITDQLPMQLPAPAWSNGGNVRFLSNKVIKFTGHETFFDPGTDWDGTGEQVYYALPYNTGTEAIWVYCGLDAVVATDGSSSEDISNGTYTATADKNWTGGILSTFLILNNGIDLPQSWTGVFNPPAGSDSLLDLANFSSQADKCGAMRVYKNYLVALDVTKSAVRYRSLVKWSDSAALGALPSSWDATDATVDAGETDLSEKIKDVNIGALIDCMPLRDTNIIYSDSQTWAMDFIGGTFVFAFRQIFKNNGILTRRCVQEFEGKHFVVGGGDVYVHDGSTLKSAIDSRNKTFLFKDMDGDNYEKTYVFPNYAETEMWVCYVSTANAQTTGEPLPNKALVWNWRSDTWGKRDLIDTPLFATPHISSGIVDTSSTDDSWANYTANHPGESTWDTVDRIWDILGFSPQEQSPLLCGDKLYKGDSTNTFDGATFESFIERTDIPLGEQDQIMRIKALYPKMSGSAAVNIHVGSQMAPGGEVDWGTPMSFTPGTDIKIDVRKTGTHAAVKVESTGDQDWCLVGYEMEVEPVGRRGTG